jgi:predicted TIM-barrel fold metal-dependent hydrolase
VTDLQWLLIVAAMFTLTLPGSLVFLAYSVRKTVNITVQAPTALLPEKVDRILSEMNEKMHPEKPTMSPAEADAAVGKIVGEARLVGEQFADNNRANGHKVTGAEKQRAAMRYVKQRLEALNLTFDLAMVAGQLESEVRRAKETKS